jgi:hypothetical protein
MAASCFLASYCTCHPEPEYERLLLSSVTHPPVDANVVSRPMVIVEGVGVMMHATPLSSNSVHFDERTSVYLRSKDSDILRIMTSSEPREFLLIGVSPGHTEVEVQVDWDYEEPIPVTVEEWSGEE